MATPRPTATHPLLIIDDDPSMHDFIRFALRSEAVTTSSAHTAEEGFRMLSEREFDVILLDLGLPDMHGLELMARLRESGSRAAVIIITADETPQSLLRAIRQNAYEYLRKPFKPADMAEAVLRALKARSDDVIEVLSAKPEWLELSIPCTRDAAERIDHFVRQLDADLGLDLMEPVALSFRELLMNAVEWGGSLDPSRRVRISCLRTPRMLCYRIADPGQGFKFQGLTHSALINPDGALGSSAEREAKGLRPGGLGLALVKDLADDLVYNEKQNEVVFVKYLN